MSHFNFRHRLRRLFHRRRADKSDERRATARGEIAPELPVDVMLHIAGFISDRETWNILISLNKELYSESMVIPAPWPSDHNIFGRGYRYEKPSYEKVVFSNDSQWMCKISQACQSVHATEGVFEGVCEGIRVVRLQIAIVNARSGRCRVHYISALQWVLCGEGLQIGIPTACFALSPNLRYLAVHTLSTTSSIIRVYNLLSSCSSESGLSFDPSRFIDLDPAFGCICIGIGGEPFAFSPNGNYLAATYASDDEEKRKTRLNTDLMCHEILVWNLNDGTFIKTPLGEDDIVVSDGSLLCRDDAVLWRPSESHSLRYWNFRESSSREVQFANQEERAGVFPKNVVYDSFSPLGIQAYFRSPTAPSILAYVCLGHPTDDSRWYEKEVFSVGILNLQHGSAVSLEPTTAVVESGTHAKGGIKGTRPLVAWFPDGEHLVFIDYQRQKAVLRRIHVSPSNSRVKIQEPAQDGLPARLVNKVNEVFERENNILRERRGNEPRRSFLFLYGFGLSADGRTMTLTMADTEPVESSTALADEEQFVILTNRIVSV